MPPRSTAPGPMGVRRGGPRDPAIVRWTLTFAAVTVITILVIVPIVNVFYQAFAGGLGAYWKNLTGDPDTRHSIFLTLTVAPVAVL